MKAKWCETCNRLFTKKEKLDEHKRTATNHKNDQIAPPKPNISPDKPQKGKSNTSPGKATVNTKGPIAASNKPAAATKIFDTTSNQPVAVVQTSKVSTSVEGKNNVQEKGPKTLIKGIGKSSQSVRNEPAPTVVTLTEPVMIVLPSTPTKYPWASKPEGLTLLATLDGCCHDQACLSSQGYHTGDFTSPKSIKSGFATFVPTPAKINGVAKRRAIALDCEMVGVAGGKSELALLCAVDLFSGEILIESLVFPIEPVKDWRSRYSGVTPAKMSAAKASGKALDGWPAARAKLFEFADADTILLGYGLHNDLKVLRIYHTRVVDPSILVAEAVFGKGKKMERMWKLKTLSREFLGVAIQTSKYGHDCLEDTLAARELVLWCLKQPEQLKAWAQKAFVEYKTEKQKRTEQQKAKSEEEKRKSRMNGSSRY